MKKFVKVVFDRKGSVAKTGYGKIELCIYFQAGERKYETVGTATPEEWEVAAQDKNVVAKIKHYEQISACHHKCYTNKSKRPTTLSWSRTAPLPMQ